MDLYGIWNEFDGNQLQRAIAKSTVVCGEVCSMHGLAATAAAFVAATTATQTAGVSEFPSTTTTTPSGTLFHCYRTKWGLVSS